MSMEGMPKPDSDLVTKSENPKQLGHLRDEKSAVDEKKNTIEEDIKDGLAIEDRIRNNTYNALSINNEEEKEFEKEWYKKYLRHPKKLEDFFNTANIEEVKSMPEEKRLFFLKMAKFYFEADINQIESDFGKDDAKKIFEYLTEERKNQLARQKNRESGFVKKSNQKSDSLTEVKGDKEKVYISRNNKEEISLRDPELVKAGKDEQDILYRISKITEEEKQRAEYGKNIDDVIGAFESSGKSKKDFDLMMEKFDAISWFGDAKRVWNQDRVDRLLQIYENNYHNLDNDICPEFFEEVLGHGEVAYFVANYFIKRIEGGEEMKKSVLDSIKRWASENIYTMNSDIVSELLLALLNNPDKVDKAFIDGIFGDIEPEYLESFVRRYSQELYKNDKDVYKILKDIEVLDYFKNLVDEEYFEEYTVKYNLKIFKQNNNNYFINTKIDQTLDYFYKTHSIDEKRSYLDSIKKEYIEFINNMPDTSKMEDNEVEEFFSQFAGRIERYMSESSNRAKKEIYDDKNIRNSYDIEPVIFGYKKYGEDKKEKERMKFAYSKICEKYGIIYSPEGRVDSFFELNGKDDGKGINFSINEVLAKEGFKKENMSEEEYKKMVLTYKTLIELPMREKIESEFNIELKDFNIREQVQFVNFLSSKTIEDVGEVKEFLNQGQGKDAKNNSIKTFLSLESGGEEMGGKILEIGERLKDRPEVADLLFSEYAKVVDNINESSEELCKIYEEMFPNKKLDKNEISQAILGRANDLLLDGNTALEKADQVKKKEIIGEIVEEFKKQTIANRRRLEEFKDISEKLKKQYHLIYVGSEGNNLDEKIHPEEIKELIMKPMMDKEIEFVNLKDQGLLKSSDRERYFENSILNYDGNKIKKDISYIEKFIEKLNNNIISIDLFLSEPKKFIKSKEGSYYSEISKTWQQVGQGDALVWAISEKKIFNNLINENELKMQKFKQIIPYQIAFENKLESLIFGKETASLGKDMFADIGEKAEKLIPEKFPSEKQAYFPVGISSNLPEWENIFKGKEKMAKPMDIYGYMFWLNNQNRSIKLVICDQMQSSNYEALYGKTHEEAIEVTKKIGEKEKRFYQKIIDTFGLKNIEILDYESFVGKDKDKFEKYRALCERLSKNPVWEKAFFDIIQESVSQKTSNEEKKNFLKYGIEEISWILSSDGVKVSHIKEARYDALANVIANAEKICALKGIDIFDPTNEKKIMPVVIGVIKELRDIYNTHKLQLEKEKGQDSCDVLYYKKMHEALSKIECKKEKPETFGVDRKDIEVNFVCPTVGSVSFGWRSAKEGEKESALKFKEAYSTYFCRGGANLFLDSDQVVASSKGHIGGKILVMENEKQRIYGEKVVKPILTEYFKVLESAPDEYFAKIKKTKEELLSQCKDSRTLSDILKFIQNNIMEPTFSR